jgi:hypothetical protein
MRFCNRFFLRKVRNEKTLTHIVESPFVILINKKTCIPNNEIRAIQELVSPGDT